MVATGGEVRVWRAVGRGADGTVWLWNLPSGNTLHVLSGHIAPVTCDRFTPDGKRILTASEDSTLILWDPREGTPRRAGAAAVQVIVSVGTDGRACTWEASRFKLRSTGTHEDAVTSLAFSPNTPTFLTGSADKTLKLWDYRTGRCVETLLGNRDVVHAVSVARTARSS
ncbi:hypothetical protein JCM1840_004283 [Sporobolomyces johnsonii]